jgi:hypothetical protein
LSSVPSTTLRMSLPPPEVMLPSKRVDGTVTESYFRPSCRSKIYSEIFEIWLSVEKKGIDSTIIYPISNPPRVADLGTKPESAAVLPQFSNERLTRLTPVVKRLPIVISKYIGSLGPPDPRPRHGPSMARRSPGTQIAGLFCPASGQS